MRPKAYWQRRRPGAELRRAAGANPLRRRAGLIRGAAWGLVLPGAAGVSVGAVAVGVWVFDSVRDPDRAVTATATATAYPQPADRRSAVPGWLVPVTWSDSSGGAHQGTVKVSSRLAKGAPVEVGLAADGSLRHQPPPAGDAWVRAGLAGVGVAAVGGVTGWACLAGARRSAERNRLRSWEVAWAQWAGRLPGHDSRWSDQ
jgi:hypothetical protein